MDAGKLTDATKAVAVEKVAMVEEDMVTIRISPITPGPLLTSKIFLGISSVPVGILFRETVKHMLAANADV